VTARAPSSQAPGWPSLPCPEWGRIEVLGQARSELVCKGGRCLGARGGGEGSAVLSHWELPEGPLGPSPHLPDSAVFMAGFHAMAGGVNALCLRVFRFKTCREPSC
jgi:hypothetical protein